MGLFSKKQDASASVPGRAVMRPGAGSFRTGFDSEGATNMNNFSAGARVGLPIFLDLVEVADGGPILGQTVELHWRVPNWVRLVLIGLDDGSGRYTGAPEPGEVRIPVRVDAASRRILSIDDELLETELAPWKDMAADVFKRTEGAFRDVHQAKELADFGRNELPGIFNEWKTAAAELKAELAQPVERPTLATSPIAPEEVARRLAEAEQQGAAMAQAGPAMLEMMRATTFGPFQAQAEAIAAGQMPGHDFDLAIECQFRMGVLTAEQLASLRATAATPVFG